MNLQILGDQSGAAAPEPPVLLPLASDAEWKTLRALPPSEPP